MEMVTLINSAPDADLPAPFWFIQLFKVLGFCLHAVPMNLWYAGLITAMCLHAFGGEHGKKFCRRLMKQMPLIVAFGVNFGIVPLLFVQLAYHRVFYPATILMAWFWLAVVLLLLPAYHFVYLYAFRLRDGRMSRRVHLSGWGAAIVFVGLGFVFANAMSLMTRVPAWPEIWQHASKAGAALGTALNLSDPTLWPRWLLMLGLALGTTAAWAVVDSAWFAGGESAEYRRWAGQIALRLFAAGFALFAAMGTWYLFTWPQQVRGTMLGFPAILLTLITAAAPALPAVWMYRARQRVLARGEAALVGLAQFGVLGVNAISRQIVQNLELRPYFDPGAAATNVQWSPLVVFLLLFVAGVGLIAWMIAQVARSAPAK